MSEIILPGHLTIPQAAGGQLINPHTGNTFAADETELKVPDTPWCAVHARQARRLGINSPTLGELWVKALLELLFYNERFARLAGFQRSKAKATLAGANRALATIGPLCCFLAGPARRQAIVLAKDPDQLKALHDRRMRAVTSLLHTP